MEPGFIVGIIGAVASIIGILTAYVFYKKGLRIKAPQFALESRPVLNRTDNTIDELKINFDNEEIKILTISRVAIWNAGKEPIYNKDVPVENKFRICSEEGYKILKAEIIKVKNEANHWSIKNKNGCVTIDFEFFDYKEGCTIQIYHTGKSSWSLRVDGYVIGSGKLLQAVHIPFPKRRRKAFLYSVLAFVIPSSLTIAALGLDGSKVFVITYWVVAIILYLFIPMLLSIKYSISKQTSLELGVRDDDEILRAPDFPPTGRIRERNKDADPYRF